MENKDLSSQREIARLANVTQATVSLVLNNRPGVSEKTRRRVIEIAEQLEYNVNHNIEARMLSLRQSKKPLRMHVLGFLWSLFQNTPGYTSILDNSFYREIFNGMSEQCARLGYSVMLLNWHNNTDFDSAMLSRLDGFVVSSIGFLDVTSVMKIARNKPMVSIMLGRPPLCDLTIDDAQAVRMAYAHLRSRGHERIGYIGSYIAPDIPTHPLFRWNSFVQCTREAGRPQDAALSWKIDTGTFNYPEQGKRGFDALWNSGDKPTAIIFYNDLMALGGLEAAAGRGVVVPRDVSFVSIDDIPEAAAAPVPLTTVSIGLHDMGRKAADLLHRFASGDPPKSGTVLMDLKLVERASVRKI